MPRAKTGKRHDAATTPQGCARPAAGNWWEIPPDCATAPPREAETPRADHRPEPQPALARPQPTRQTSRKGRLKFLYPGGGGGAACPVTFTSISCKGKFFVYAKSEIEMFNFKFGLIDFYRSSDQSGNLPLVGFID